MRNTWLGLARFHLQEAKSSIKIAHMFKHNPKLSFGSPFSLDHTGLKTGCLREFQQTRRELAIVGATSDRPTTPDGPPPFSGVLIQPKARIKFGGRWFQHDLSGAVKFLRREIFAENRARRSEDS